MSFDAVGTAAKNTTLNGLGSAAAAAAVMSFAAGNTLAAVGAALVAIVCLGWYELTD